MCVCVLRCSSIVAITVGGVVGWCVRGAPLTSLVWRGTTDHRGSARTATPSCRRLPSLSPLKSTCPFDLSLSHTHTHTAAVWRTVGSPQTIRQLWRVSILPSPQHRGGGCYPTTMPITTTSGVRVRVCVVFTANVSTYYNCMA